MTKQNAAHRVDTGDGGHTVERCRRALDAATALAAGSGPRNTVLETYWEKQLAFAEKREAAEVARRID